MIGDVAAKGMAAALLMANLQANLRSRCAIASAESSDIAAEEFGEQRLVDALRHHRALPSRPLLDSILAEVREFSPREQYDAITLIAARCVDR